MTKPRKTETELVSADVAVPAKPAAKKAGTKASSAAMHKHTAKKSAKTLTDKVSIVESAPEAQSQPRIVTDGQIAARAYEYWEARGYQGGSAEDDWFRAERELRGE